MKAIIYERFGPPEVLQIKEVEEPIPENDEVLVKIYATTVAAEDPGFRGEPGLNGMRKPKNPILGFYLAGVVEAVGKDVKRFNPGDEVYGNTGMKLGTYAQYTCIPEDGALVPKPANLSYEEAASIPNGVLTSLPFLRDQGRIQSGQKVLINGASGAVGTSAVQLAKHFGAEVTGVCSTTNLGLVKSMGADHVIDYTQEDFTQSSETYDIIFDAVGKSSFSQCKDSLKQGGSYLTTIPTLAAIPIPKGGGKKARFTATGLRSTSKKAKDLDFINELIEAGKIKPVIDRVYPMEEIIEAHRYVETGRKQGNVVITIDS